MIDMQPSSEQTAIVDSVASFLADRLPRDRLRPEPAPRLNDDGAAWPDMGALGIFALGLPEDCGGSGYGLVEELLVHREFGRFLLSPAATATAIAARLAATAGDAQLASSIGTGAVRVALALPDRSSGQLLLLDAADAAFVLHWTENGLALFSADAFGERAATRCIDSTVSLERANVSGDAMLRSESAAAQRQATLLACAYLVGIAEAACDQSVEYAKVRQQFGQPIGAFQAVKHRCADMLVRASAAWNLTLFAALAETAESADAEFQVRSARVIAADAAFRNAAVNIQNHGGIGFTAEHDAHLFVKRTHMFDLLGGDSSVQKKRLLAAPAPFASTLEPA